jgi:hypothetical protein
MMSVILARSRSGTGALGSVLDQHPALTYLGEVFHPDGMEYEYSYFRFLLGRLQSDLRWLHRSPQHRFQEYHDFLLRRFGPNPILDVKYVSTHHFNPSSHGPIDKPHFLRLVMLSEMPIIHLKRRNFVKTWVSERLAELNQVWHAHSPEQIKYRSVGVDIDQLWNYLLRVRWEVEVVDWILADYPHQVVLEYDEVFDANQRVEFSALERIARLLQVDAFVENRPMYIKQAGWFLEEVIENFDAVEEALRDTEFHHLLYS